MAETLFIADESDVRRSIDAVRTVLPVVFLQQKRWDTPNPVPSADLSEYPELCRSGMTFFVLRSPEAVKMREVKGSDGKPLWEFDYRGTTAWIMVEAGGRWEKAGDKRWVPGRVRANLSDQSEKELYTEFKKHWLKGYKAGKENLKFGPSAAVSLADEVIATW